MSRELSESQRRLYEKLHRDLGEEIAQYLDDTDVNEVMLNPDGNLWIDSSSRGLLPVSQLNSSQAFSIINDIAGIHNFELNI